MIDETGTWLQQSWYQEYEWYFALKAFIERRGIRVIRRRMKNDAGILHTEGKLEITINTPDVGLVGIMTLIHEYTHWEMGHRHYRHLGDRETMKRYGLHEIQCILASRLVCWMFYIAMVDDEYIFSFADCDDEIRATALSIAYSIADAGIFPHMRIKGWWIGDNAKN